MVKEFICYHSWCFPCLFVFIAVANTNTRTMRVQHVRQQLDFNPLCRITESAIDGSLMVKMMLRGNSAVQQTHDEFLTLKRYIDGWLYFKEKRKVRREVIYFSFFLSLPIGCYIKGVGGRGANSYE